MDVKKLLKLCIGKSASDLHIIPNIAPTIRADGILAPLKELPVLTSSDTKKMLYALLSSDEIAQFECARVYEFALSTEMGNFRVSIYNQMNGVAGAFRVIPEKIPTLDELKLPAVLKKILLLSRGLILVAGPCGSGKSTSLAAMIDYINTYRICNIVTIEDPIEFVFENKRSIFNQIQVGRDAIDFSKALRASLRQDPNVIMLGELRDLETMRLALTAVETGHLVLATIHASSAALAINRFVDVFPSEEKLHVRALLSESVEAVICQRLVRKSSGGRLGVFEMMVATASIRNYIRQDMPSNIESSMQTGGEKGMVTFEFAIDQLVKNRIITPLIAENMMSELRTMFDFVE